MREITQRAWGKINLCLDVTGKRDDGYHLVRMIMQTVGIYDTVEIRRQEGSGEISLSSDAGDIPSGPENLVWRAADAMRKTFGIADGLSIHLEKKIPVAAGMAGGSSDAAAVLRGIRDLYALDADDRKLRDLGLSMGADIPYCVGGGTQLSEGIGEVLTVLPDAPECHLVVTKPDLYVSTGWVYKAFDSIEKDQIRHPDVDGMVRDILRGDLPSMAAKCGNVLEQKTGSEYPVIGELEDFLLERGALTSIMTGSGPTVFGIFDDRKKAEAAFAALQERGQYSAFQKFMTGFVNPEKTA